MRIDLLRSGPRDIKFGDIITQRSCGDVMDIIRVGP